MEQKAESVNDLKEENISAIVSPEQMETEADLSSGPPFRFDIQSAWDIFGDIADIG